MKATSAVRVNSGTLLFRCDANPAIGTGHVMRCLALGQEWRASGGRAVFAACELPSGLEARLSSEGMELVRTRAVRGSEADASAVAQAARDSGAKWVVADGDEFDVDFLHLIHRAGLRVLLIDDFAQRRLFPADLILNPNLGVLNEDYQERADGGHLLLGPDYMPVRREFTSNRFDREFPESAHRVLVSLGGSDPENLSPQIAQALRRIDGLHLTVVAGASYEHWNELQKYSASNVAVVSNRSDMNELMQTADLAITAAGGTLLEMLFSGCAVLSYFRNSVQGRAVGLAATQGAVWSLGGTSDFNASALAVAVRQIASEKTLRERMAEAGRALIDGRGAERVITAIQAAG